MSSYTKADWLIPSGLIALTLVPLIAGVVRVVELASGAPVTADNARFFAAPFPVVVHIICSGIFGFLGALQFSPGFRREKPRWHRVSGRLLVVCGVTSALTGLWMTLSYPHVEGDGNLLYSIRLVFGSAMLGSIILAFAAIRKRNIAEHRAWIMRGYAIGMGAGTQVFTHVPWLLLVGQPKGLSRDLLMAAGWVINLALAEWIIRRRRM